MRRPWCLLFGVVAVGTVTALVVETRRLAELAGHWEVEARTARTERAEAVGALGIEAAARTAVAAEAARLSAELATATTQLQGISDVLGERTERFLRATAEAEAAAARALAPMGEGVRLCLHALHECLRAEGFTSQRFLSARRLDAEGLHEVELLDVESDGLGVAFVYAGRMTAELDRGKGRLTLRFFDGHRSIGGERIALPTDGYGIVFEPVDPRSFEERLPYLVRVAGAYPVAEDKPKRAATDVDPATRWQWLERFDRLLASAETAQSLRVTRFRGMQGGCFLQVELVGTDKRNRVLSSAHCARLAVEVDDDAGVVSLLLQDGVLRNAGVESTISAEGYRMLLPNLTPKQACDTMLGMVVHK